MSEEHKQDAPAYDERGNVRPTDARFTGADRKQLTAAELQAIREQEVSDGWAKVAEQAEAEQAANDKRLAEAGYVNPTLPAEVPVDDDQVDEDEIEDRYTDMSYAELQAEAKDRDGMSAGGSAAELQARLRADDVAKAGA